MSNQYLYKEIIIINNNIFFVKIKTCKLNIIQVINIFIKYFLI